ncbi:protein AIM2 NDAI_0A08780 [Naumovozyma dairenensis CBS 421]|uniref:Dienelactone hydrolase domain-containing protein n=1 Tax=Naumovozyma dairenensis (strain ATCC 10597 / BCRC 20456 / CBS 421 / NBRC 0211 / NRRL Y-12639) TaxID=1071378 RepID=G0W5E3_NAUDC|nr:hypothetical protein NDAI_0A08780 [Naumovozyma dairenensis CBS 421]CCD23031.1 hypothetical protein NDAI_0A08780 [Naumovozyma dairenensis CBS 421]
MASNPPGKCCFSGYRHEGETSGVHEMMYNVETYITGTTSPSDKVIVIMTDVYGNHFTNVLLIADQLALAGFKVYIPDILFGDIVSSMDGSVDFNGWLAKHDPITTRKIVDNFLSNLRKEFNPKFVGIVGYCFGAKFAVQQISEVDGLADICAIAHPSGVSIDELKLIGKNKPLLIAAAETDPIFPAELRHQTEDTLKEIGARYQIDLFSGVSHGFASRGDASDPVIKYAMDKALHDQIFWFKHFSKVNK